MGNRRPTGADVKAGVTLGLESVPDDFGKPSFGGVNPASGLYADKVGTAGPELSICGHQGGY